MWECDSLVDHSEVWHLNLSFDLISFKALHYPLTLSPHDYINASRPPPVNISVHLQIRIGAKLNRTRFPQFVILTDVASEGPVSPYFLKRV